MLKLCVFAAGVHLLFLYSVFDLYFTSPLVQVSRHHSIVRPPAAKRLVLFVCDGLRVDKFFDNNVRHAPYLRGLMETGAVYGVSNTKVPTESRPGHVAMIAGFYEDVAAITKGWKENPVEFDSFFNQSRHTWAWGSPDILPMFERGSVPGRVSTNMYDSSFEDFATDASVLDTWVFDHVKAFFESQNNEGSLLTQDKLVFFLHLLGTDTIGHADKPQSSKYVENIALVDDGVRRTVEIIEKFFNSDGQTAFIFSSDHGMRDWGSHGAGHPDETMTPFVGWGAGFEKPNEKMAERAVGFDDLAKMPHISQADIAPLMSCLVGANYPANSVGKIHINLLAVEDGYKAECLLANARQLAETAVNQHKAYKANSLLSFSPYPDFDIDLIEKNIKVIEDLVFKGQLRAVQQQASIFIDHMLSASLYYHTYNNTYLGIAISSGFLLWIVYLIMQILHYYAGTHETWSRRPFYSCGNFIYLSISAGVFMVLLLKRSPLSHYVYWLLPVYLGCEVAFDLVRRRSNSQTTTLTTVWFSSSVSRNLICFSVIICCLEAIVWSFWQRTYLAFAILGAALFTFVFSSNRQQSSLFPVAISCLVVFPLLPPADSGQQTFELVYGVTVVVFLAIVASFCFSQTKPHCNKACKNARISQAVLLAVALLVKILTVVAIANRSRVPVLCHFLSWLLLIAVWLPVFWTCSSKTWYGGRLPSAFIAVFTVYSLLSVYYESLYLIVLQVVLLIWVSNSKKVTETVSFGAIIADSFLLVVLVNVSLLAPANIAVINSFDLVSVYTFLTLFSPFVIMALLIFKVVMPILCVVLAFVEICHTRNYSLTTSLFLVTALSDFTALHFFFAVRTEGSWLEIGTSLSHYCVQMFAAVALIPFVAIARLILYGKPIHKTALSKSA